LLSLAVLASLPASSGAARGRADDRGRGDLGSLLAADREAPDALALARRSGLEAKEREEQWVMIILAPPGSLTPISSPYAGPRRSYFGDGMASAGF
jgi:hypothetical protein